MVDTPVSASAEGFIECFWLDDFDERNEARILSFDFSFFQYQQY